MHIRSRLTSATLAVILTCAAAVARVRGEDPPRPAPAPTGAARPLLKQLNQEVQSLYHEVQAGVCRVQLPPPKWAGQRVADADAQDPVQKWAAELDPAVKARLEQVQKDADKGRFRKVTASVDDAPTKPAQPPANLQGQSATQSATGAWTLSTKDGEHLEFRPNGNNAGALKFDAGGHLAPDGQIVGTGGRVSVSVDAAASSFTPNNVGLLLDTQGHILVPIAVEKESFDPEGVRVMVGQGQMAMAKFVGSDRQTNITLLKLDKPLGTPVKLAKDRPQEGALAMFLAPNSGVGRLVIWSNEIKDWGVVVSMEGGIYGFTRQGQFLSASACKPAIDQLAKAGQVKRAKLGLGIAEVAQNDADRATSPLLGTRPAVRVTEIAPNSIAATADLKVNDLILELNDQPVGDPHSFAAAMSDPSPKATLKLLREGKEKTLTLDLPDNR